MSYQNTPKPRTSKESIDAVVAVYVCFWPHGTISKALQSPARSSYGFDRFIAVICGLSKPYQYSTRDTVYPRHDLDLL
jgi:hypothetical protein